MKLKNVLAFALAACSALSMAETYALSIGINDYPEAKDEKGQPVDNDLKGCVNDANSMQDLFKTKFGVKPTNMRKLLDKDVTMDKFIDNMKWLLQSAKAGDQVVFTYSGHGAQVEDKSEEDGKEEVLVLQDGTLIPGDLFGEIAKTLNINGIHTTFIFDSCFSGGMSRATDGKIVVRNKALGLVKPKSATALATASKRFLDAGQPNIRARAPQQTSATSAFFFASAEDKTSSDISGLEGIDPHGIFTLLLLATMEEDAKMPVADMYGVINGVLDGLNKKIKEQGGEMQFNQAPNFETSSGREKNPLLLAL